MYKTAAQQAKEMAKRVKEEKKVLKQQAKEDTKQQHIEQKRTLEIEKLERAPSCIHCQEKMTTIKKEARYGIVGQALGVILFVIIGGWWILPLLFITGATMSGVPFLIFLVIGSGVLFALNQKIKLRICNNCGYYYKIKK